MEGLSARLASLRVSRLTAGILLVLCFAAGYLFAAWLSGVRDTTPLARICSRVDYVNGLQEQLEGQQAASEEVREEFKALVEECRAALSSRAEENDLLRAIRADRLDKRLQAASIPYIVNNQPAMSRKYRIRNPMSRLTQRGSPMTRREAVTGLLSADTQNPIMIALAAFRRLASWATPTNLRLNAIP